jgi:hypothetical protein
MAVSMAMAAVLKKSTLISTTSHSICCFYVTPNFSQVTYCYSTFLFHYYSYSSTHFCLLDFSEMPWSNYETL